MDIENDDLRCDQARPINVSGCGGLDLKNRSDKYKAEGCKACGLGQSLPLGAGLQMMLEYFLLMSTYP